MGVVKPTFFSLIFLLALAACDPNSVFEENLKIEDAEWNRGQKAIFSFNIEDTTEVYELYFNFRHAGDYPYKNIYLFSRTISPSNKLAVDTAQMILADNQGRWMGKGIGDIYDYRFQFKKGDLFPESGTYTIEIEQGMRNEVLPNVTDIGISVMKQND